MSSAAVTTLTRRCAWCDLVWTGDGWQPLPNEPERRDYETATCCPECVEALTRAFKTAVV